MPQPAAEKLWTPSFIIGTLANFASTLNYFMLMVVMTSYALAVYQAPESLAAFTASIFIIGTLFARVFSGVVMERAGRKRLAIVGVLLTIAFTALYLVDMSLPVLLCVRFAHGFAYGVFSTCMATIVTAIVPKSRKGEGIGYFMLSVTLGAAIGPFAGIFVAGHFDFRLLFILAIGAAVLTLLLVLPLRVPKVRPTAREAAEERAAQELADASVLDAPEPLAEFEAPADARQTHQQARRKPARTAVDRVIEVGVLPIGCVAFLVYFGYSSLLTFLTPFAQTVDMTAAASVFFIAYAISMFVTRPFTGKAFDRCGPRPVMLPAFVSFALGMLMLSAVANDWMMLGSALLCGFGVGTVQSCGLAMAVRATPDARLSLANSTFYMLLDVGVGVGPLLLGMFVPLIGYRSMYACMAIVALLAMVLFLFVSRSAKRRG